MESFLPDVFSHLLIRAENVKRQRFLSLIDEANGIVHVAYGHYGQQWPEDFLLHQPRMGGDVLQHCWCCGVYLR